MNKANHTFCTLAFCLALGMTAGCDRNGNQVAPAERTSSATENPQAGDDHSQEQAVPPSPQKAGAPENAQLKLTGLTMRPDPEWVAQPIEPGPMAPVAVYALPADTAVGQASVPHGGAVERASVPADAKPVEIRITHYPAMKGQDMDRMNINRWVSSVRRPDGTPATMQDAAITIKTIGHVRLTIVDITGTVMPMMGERSASPSDQRLIAAIVDHPRGPHFVKVMGPPATIEKWEKRILAFLDSATVAP